MACKYIIKTRTGDVLLDIPTSSSEFSEKDFLNSLKELGVENLNDLFEKIKESKNSPINLNKLNLSNIIKTTNLDYIRKYSPNIYFNSDISAKLYDLSKSLINKLEESGEKVFENNLIYTKTESKFNPNLGNAYDVESNTFVINSSPKGEVDFISLNKGLIDMYILKHSKNIQTLINKSFKDINKFIENSVFLYNTNKIPSEILNAIQQELGLDKQTLDYIFKNHSETLQDLKEYKGKTLKDLNMYAKNIFIKFGELANSKNRQFYYNEKEISKTYPLLKSGDLLKVKAKNSNLKNGVFNIYLDHYDVNGIRYYVLQSIDNPKIYNTYSESEVKFDNNFEYQRNLVDTLSRKKLSVVENIPADKLIYYSNNGEKISNELVKTLKPGDAFEYYFNNKDGNQINLTAKVIDIKGNQLIYYNYGKDTSAKITAIGRLNITVLKYNSDNHSDFNDYDPLQLRSEISHNLESFEKQFQVNDNILNNLKQNDIILTENPNNPEARFYNKFIEKDSNGNYIVIAKSGNKIFTKTINKNDVKGVIYNFINHKNLILKTNEIKEDIKNSFITSINSNVSNLSRSNNYSLFNLNNNSKLSDTIKQDIKSGDYININDNYYLVLDNYNPELRLYNLDTNSIELNNITNIKQLVRTSSQIDAYSEHSIRMNSTLIGTEDKLNEIFQNNTITKEEVRYVIPKEKISPVIWLDGKVNGAYVVNLNNFNSSKYIDLTKEYLRYNTEKIDPNEKLYQVTNGKQIYKNTIGTNKYNISNLNIDDVFNLLSIGSYISIDKGFKNLRIEEKLDNGLLISYNYINWNGDITKLIEFIPKEKLATESGNNIFALYVPKVQTIMNDKLKNYQEIIKPKHNLVINESDTSEILKHLSEFIKNKFNVKVNLGSTEDFNNNGNLRGIEVNENAFIKNGEIYINTDNASIESPIHEMMHLILGTLKIINPSLYEEMLNKIDNNINDYQQEISQINSTYSNLTYYETLEELFVDLFSKNLKGELLNKEFNDDNFLEGVNQTISNIFQIDTKNIDNDTLFNTPLNELLCSFGSKLIENPESLYDANEFSLSENLYLIKKEMFNNKKLTQNCE